MDQAIDRIPSSSIVVEDIAEELAVMDTAPSDVAGRRPPSRILLTPPAALLLAISLGLCAGYLDVALILLKKVCLNPEGYFRAARDFPWTVPLGHAALMALPGAVVAALCWVLPRLVSLNAGAWLLATLAIWAALLRMPLYGACSLVMAAGLARLIGDAVAARGAGARRARLVPVALVGVLGCLAAITSGRQALSESRAVAGLPPAPRARNDVLIVWDTVRTDSLSGYGNPWDATPNLARWARSGVEYRYALAPAPWTYPSHTCFFTGQWPWKINTQWNLTLDTPDPTLAEYLAARGYQTVAFVANTNSCTYESRLDRGFAHFEDYSPTPLSVLSRTVPGQWVVTRLLRLGGWYHDDKWAGLQSRDARAITGAFLGWLGRRRPDRPFFAFLNYFDAHEPYIPPAEFAGRSGIRPRTARDYQFLIDYVGAEKTTAQTRQIFMARDCYVDCIAYLDAQLGRLLDELGRQGLLANTDVIITSDHGEAFGEHGYSGHAISVNLEEIRVPLVILSPDAPAGQQVFHPVSLRDLPATVVDRLGVSEGSPFPGRSLAVYWGLPPGIGPPGIATPALSEQANRMAQTAFPPQPGPGGLLPGFQVSLVSWNYHYIRDGEGSERLYDLIRDPLDKINLAASADRKDAVEAFRTMLLKVLNDSPGSVEVERAYLEEFRRSLEAQVRRVSAGRVAGDPRIATDGIGR
jgi:arylsulfatase A-like enzyme